MCVTALSWALQWNVKQHWIDESQRMCSLIPWSGICQMNPILLAEPKGINVFFCYLGMVYVECIQQYVFRTSSGISLVWTQSMGFPTYLEKLLEIVLLGTWQRRLLLKMYSLSSGDDEGEGEEEGDCCWVVETKYWAVDRDLKRISSTQPLFRRWEPLPTVTWWGPWALEICRALSFIGWAPSLTFTLWGKKLSFSLHFCLQLQQLHFWPRKSCTTLNHSPIHRRVALFHFLKFPLSQQTISPSLCFFPLNFSPFTPSSPVSWFYPHPLFPLFSLFLSTSPSPPSPSLPPGGRLPSENLQGGTNKCCYVIQCYVMPSNALSSWVTPCYGREGDRGLADRHHR